MTCCERLPNNAIHGPSWDRTRDKDGALGVLRDLFLHGPRRFQDFQESLAGIAPNTLSARLKTLETQGVIARRLYSEHPPRLEYHLTEKGKSLGPVLKALKTWGERYG